MNSGKLLIILMQCFLGCIVLILPAFLIYLFMFVFYSGEELAIQNADILPKDVVINGRVCDVNQKLGIAGKTLIQAKSGFRYTLKTPLNYSSLQAWPVLIVFSPMLDGNFMERYTGLTAPITRAGFIIAYVDSVAMNTQLITQLPELIQDITYRWCVDERRIFLAGHSDGATIAQALNFLPDINLDELKLAGFISSAAGLRQEDLQAYACPNQAIKAFVLQNSEDKHFLNFGKGAAEWWAMCQQCEKIPSKAEEGCIVYENCQKGGVVKFCEQLGSHLKWPERHKEIIDFLK